MFEAEIAARQLGTTSGGSPLTLADIDHPGSRYDAILCVRLFGWEGIVRLRQSPYDGRVRAEYRNPDWQYSQAYRDYVAASRAVPHA